MYKRDKEKHRSDNREYYDQKSADPEWRAKKAAKRKDYRENGMSLEIRENERRSKRLHSKRRQIWRRALAFDYYGDHCVCCSENKYYFLCIDHINGGGNKHKKQEKWWRLYDWLFKNNWPEGFQVLCNNCNIAKHRFGKCPCGEEEAIV